MQRRWIDVPNAITNYTVLRLATISESGLALLALIWVYLAELTLPLQISDQALLWGALGAIPMLVANFFIIEPLFSDTGWYKAFRDDVIYPLCKELTIFSIFAISVLSGFCEELFFRGAVQSGIGDHFGQGVGVIGASILFSAMHFGPALFRYFILGAIYLLAGFYLSAIAIWGQSLVSAMLTHAIYNFVAMSVIRRRIRSH